MPCTHYQYSIILFIPSSHFKNFFCPNSARSLFYFSVTVNAQYFTSIGYTQDEIDHLFNSIVIPKLLYGLSVYAASVSELTVTQRFLKRCYKRRYTSVNYNIYELLAKSDRRLFYNLKRDDHPLKSLLPRYKDCIVNLRRKSIVRPSINTERFKDSFFNRLILYIFTVTSDM